jgi:hypothetical protein
LIAGTEGADQLGDNQSEIICVGKWNSKNYPGSISPFEKRMGLYEKPQEDIPFDHKRQMNIRLIRK